MGKNSQFEIKCTITIIINYFALFLLGGEFVVLDECGDILDIVKEEIKQEPKDNMNPVVRLHKLPSNWTELKEAELQNNYHRHQSNLPSTVSPVSTVWRSQEFRDRFGMIQTRRSTSTGAASTSTGAASRSTGARPKTFIPKKRIVYDVDRNGRR